MEAEISASMLFYIYDGAGCTMAESTVPRDTAEQVARGNLLYEEQQRKIRNFRTWVIFTWVILLVILLILFSGPIQLDTEFMRENFWFIAQGIPETLKVSAASILLAM